jgi:2-polyprenyl-3-methyl-5-hydroxy-6-metoxy-1,4-benzoquinol methylase
MGDEYHTRCIGCGADSLVGLNKYQRAHLTRCTSCGLVFAMRIPTRTELDRQYAHYPETAELPRLTQRRYGELLETLEPVRETGRLADIGCGDGHFLAEAQSRGWRVMGTEYGRAPIGRARARGLAVRQAPFMPSEREFGEFDVVTAFEVIEHVADPRCELQMMRALLRPGGVLYLTTPNFASLARLVLGADWPLIDYPEHLVYFTRNTLDRLLRRLGFEPIYARTTGVSLSVLRRGVARRRARASVASPPGVAAASREARRGLASRDLDQRIRAQVARSATLRAAVAAADSVLSAIGCGDTLKMLYRAN